MKVVDSLGLGQVASIERVAVLQGDLIIQVLLYTMNTYNNVFQMWQSGTKRTFFHL